MKPSTNSPALTSFIDYFEALTPADLGWLERFYAWNASFQDPFNEVVGLAHIRKIFADMFEQLHEPGFKILTIFEKQGQSENGHEAFVTWDFTFRFRAFRSSETQCVRGASHLIFDKDGLLVMHRDYWDAAGGIYEKVPVLGKLMRWLRRRLSVD